MTYNDAKKAPLFEVVWVNPIVTNMVIKNNANALRKTASMVLRFNFLNRPQKGTKPKNANEYRIAWKVNGGIVLAPILTRIYCDPQMMVATITQMIAFFSVPVIFFAVVLTSFWSIS